MLNYIEEKQARAKSKTRPRILFLDQSSGIGGAELCLFDIAEVYREDCSVVLFSDGPFRHLLESRDIAVQVVGEKAIALTKDGGLQQSLKAVGETWPRIRQIAVAARQYDLIYANTPKALVVGALASMVSGKPLVYHLHDIISPEHFSYVNIHLLVQLANAQAVHVIANSEASRDAFIKSGGKRDRVSVVYNGFDPSRYQVDSIFRTQIRKLWGWPDDVFVIGHFSRISPWKGQHILLEALQYCPKEVVAIFVGDALFGEDEYRALIYDQLDSLRLGDRVKFLGFQDQVPELMSACDMIAHTSTAPEPFGRVIVEGMLAGKPVVAASAGGALELIETGRTGWLTPPNDVLALAAAIRCCYENPGLTGTVVDAARTDAVDRFQQARIRAQIAEIINGCGVLA